MSAPFLSEWIDQLLALDDADQQLARLRQAGLLNGDGLGGLLDAASRLMREDPGKAGRLAGLCVLAARAAALPVLESQAAYLQAQSQAIDGDFNAALALLETARSGFLAQGDSLAALRTNVGLMHVLNELGRYDEVLAAGRAILEAVNEIDDPSGEAALLAARAWQNMGICYETTGRYDEALIAYASAAAGYQDGGLSGPAAQIANNRGVVLLALGRVKEAEAAFRQARAVFEAAGETLPALQSLVNSGNALLLSGRYGPCLEAFESARRMLNSLAAGAEQIILLVDTAYAYLALNLHQEAADLFRDALARLEASPMARQRARAYWGLGAALTGLGQLVEADPLLEQAAALFASAGDLAQQAAVMLERSALLAARGDQAAAKAAARAALALLVDDDGPGISPVTRTFAHLRLADLYLPDIDAAEDHLLAARLLLDQLALPHLRFRFNQRLGRLRRLQGRDQEAQELLEAAIEDIEGLRATLTQEAIRASFLDDKTAAYEDLLRLFLSRGDEESLRQAFALVERAKSRALVDLLSGELAGALAAEADPETAASLQALQADLDAIYSQLLVDDGGESRHAKTARLQARAASVERHMRRLRLQQAAQQGGDAKAGQETAARQAFASVSFSPDMALIAYHFLGDEIMAFCLLDGRLHVQRQLSTVSTVQALMARLDQEWQRFEAGAAFVQRHAAQLERSVQRVLAALYGEIMAPIDALLAEQAPLPGENAVRKLVIAPFGLLHQLPFHALFDGSGYLVERAEISVTPSATVLALCQGRVKAKPASALVIGVADAHIPAAVQEARRVARCLPAGDILLDEAATLAALRTRAGDHDVLHLACHGLFRPDNPPFSALQLRDGWLLAADVMELRLPGALVTLSACESGRSCSGAADEPLGLARAFLGAGAASVVVSLWLVHDESTAELMIDWYGRLAQGAQRVAALRAAQLALKERYPHPYFWAPFVLVGGR